MVNKMRVCDYVTKFLNEELGIDKIFMISGGGAMFLNDSVASNDNVEAVCNHHEQASAMAAVGYAKYTNGFSAVYPTTGCGSTNVITGLLDAWQDGVKTIFISGQVNLKQTVKYSGLPIRQIGVQEVNIIPIISSLTKYSEMVDDRNKIKYHLQKAIHLASSGRPGPVWLDIPLDIQASTININDLEEYDPEDDVWTVIDNSSKLKELFNESKRPIIIAGNGIRSSNTIDHFKTLIEGLNIPFVTTSLGADVLPFRHDLYIGRIGIKGDRAGNFALQNSDLIISLGSRLSVASVGYNKDLFGREAKLVVVDINLIEHKKETTNIDLFIRQDLNLFFEEHELNKSCSQEWVNKCLSWKHKWPTYSPDIHPSSYQSINLYHFINELSNNMGDDDVLVADAGSSFYVTHQAFHNQENQRIIIPGGQAEMGFTIPASIGASLAARGKSVIGLTGDGSFQFNLQELQTIKYYNLPIKLFVLNNNGYLSIRTTINNVFEGRHIGTDPNSGVSFPQLSRIAKAYDIEYHKLEDPNTLSKDINQILKINHPVICEIIGDPNQKIIPTVGTYKTDEGKIISRPLEDMKPFLDRGEFYSNMIIKPIT